jgi:hypothetical protein
VDLFNFSQTDTLGASEELLVSFLDKKGAEVDFTRQYDYSILVTADSLSGSNAGTVNLQVSNGNIWTTIDTDTIDGTTRQFFLYEGIIRARKLRVQVTTPSGAKSIALNVQASAKRVK